MRKGLFQKIKPTTAAVVAAYCLCLILGPLMLSGYTYSVVNSALIYILCIYGAQILTGMGGQISFAYVTFMGLGAYFAADMLTGRIGGFTMSPVAVLILTPVVVGVFGCILGYLLLRMEGTFFTFGTIGLVNVTTIIMSNQMSIFNGPNGIPAIPTMSVGSFRFTSNTSWFYFLMVLVAIGYVIVERIRATKFGRSLAYIAGSGTAAKCLGIDVYWTKIKAFVISSMFCGLAGALFSMQSQFISPELFNFTQATSLVLMLMIGGLNNTIGAPIGALLVVAIPEAFRSLKNFLYFGYGIAIILLMIFFPTGIAGIGKQVSMTIRKKKKLAQQRKEEAND